MTAVNEHPLLRVRDLKVEFHTFDRVVAAVRGVSFDVHEGRTLAIVGESGCGKSVTVHSILGLIPTPPGRITDGSARLRGEEILGGKTSDGDDVRGTRIGLIPQEPMSALNPTMTIGDQIAEMLRVHKGQHRRAAWQKAIELLRDMGIDEPEHRARAYPFQFSGGMLQRCMIAMAIACEPDILVADEPTTALDVILQAQILDLLGELQARNRMAMILITHDLGVVSRMADDVAVMYAGEIVEQGPAPNVFTRCAHPYFTGLKAAMPTADADRLQPIEGVPPNLSAPPPGCGYVARCPSAMEVCRVGRPMMYFLGDAHAAQCWLHDPDCPHEPDAAPSAPSSRPRAPRPTRHGARRLVQVENLKKCFPYKRLGKRHKAGMRTVVQDVSFDVMQGEIVGLVGESGSGKSTLGKMLLGLHDKTAGTVLFGDEPLPQRYQAGDFQRLACDVQMIFQDTGSSLNPRMTAGESVGEALRLHAHRRGPGSTDQRVSAMFDEVGLGPHLLSRYPHELSGGQRQRVAIARALVLEPRFLVCDEPISKLDVSVQAQVVNLLDRLRHERGITMLFIAHDLSMVRYIADRILVMYRGRLVEEGPATEVFRCPHHPYAQALMNATLPPDPAAARALLLTGLNHRRSPATASGCAYADRCAKYDPRECQSRPPFVAHGSGRRAACHLAPHSEDSAGG